MIEYFVKNWAELRIIVGIIGAFSSWQVIKFYYTQFALYSYLKKHHYKRWCEITTFGPFGPGAQNSIRGINYIFSDLEIDDFKILQYKKTLRRGCLLLIVNFLTGPPFLVLAFGIPSN